MATWENSPSRTFSLVYTDDPPSRGESDSQNFPPKLGTTYRGNMTATVPTVFAPGVNIGQLVILADAGYWQGKPHWKVRCRKCEAEPVVIATD